MKTKTAVFSAVILGVFSFGFAQVRSELYPANWNGNSPTYILNGGSPNNSGNPANPSSSNIKFLHDFSYAGYEKGEKTVPTTVSGQTYNVTQAPFNANNSGTADATAAIQAAIDAAYNAGGGTVYLPAGTYRVSPGTRNWALRITGSNILFKGDGVGRTFIYCSEPNMRFKSVINVGWGGNWGSTYQSVSSPLAQSIGNYPTTQITVQNAGAFNVGDWVAIRNDRTQGWIDAHNMGGFWSTAHNNIGTGVMFMRRITAKSGNTLTIDIPTRYWMHINDNARVYKLDSRTNTASAGWTMNTGLQDFSIANARASGNGWGEEDYKTSTNGSYNVNNAFLIKYTGVVNGWLRNVKTYNPGNANHENREVHMVSNGLDINQSARLTIDNVDFSNPQYRGGGGNGYGINMGGQDVLISNSSSSRTRHVYAFKYGYTNGNVVYNFASNNTTLASDFHMYLSMSNLIDCQNLNNDFIETCVRPYGGTAGNIHGHSSSQTVIWNTNSIVNRGRLVDSRQYGYGYVIGTRGTNASNVQTTPTNWNTAYGQAITAPEDHREHINNGTNLEPASLYYDQLKKRLGSVVDNTPINIPATFNSTRFVEKSSEVSSNGYYVGNLVNNSYMDYLLNVQTAGTYTIVLNTARNSDAARNVAVSLVGGGKLCDISIPAGSDWFAFSPVASGNINLPAGEHKLRLSSNGSVNIENITIGQPISLPGEFGATQFLNKSSEITINPNGYIGNLVAGSHFEYLVNVAAAGDYTLTLNTATGNNNFQRVLSVFSGSAKLGDLQVINGTNWEAFTQISTTVSLSAGVQVLRFESTGAVNVEKITLATQSADEILVNLTIPDGGYEYNGTERRPAVSVSIGGETLTTGFTTEYSNNINAGTAAVTVTHAGQTKTAQFSIVKREVLFTLDPKIIEFDWSENGGYNINFPIRMTGFYSPDNLGVFTLTNESGSRQFTADDILVNYGVSNSVEDGEEADGKDDKIPAPGDYPITLFVDGELTAANYSAVFDGELVLRANDPNPVSIKPNKPSNGKYGIVFTENIARDKAEITINAECGIRNAELKIYDMTGNVVYSGSGKGEKFFAPTKDTIVWNLRNTAGRNVANGTYLVIVEVKCASGQRYHYSAKLGVKR